MGNLALVEAPIEILNPENLDGLARSARAEHAEVHKAATSALAHAVRAGCVLNVAYTTCPKGEWLKWLTTTGIPVSTAGGYMRLATYRAQLRTDEHDGTVFGALKYLKGLPPARDGNGSGKRLPTEVRAAIVRLHEEGVPGAEIARLLSVTRNTVYCYTNPERWRRNVREAQARRRHRRRLERYAAQERAIQQAVRKAGSATQEAWAMAERMQDVLAQAQRETDDREARRALSEAGVHYRKMRDEIVRALGVA